MRPGEVQIVRSLEDVEARVFPAIKLGDCVRLRSGGPWMTVQQLQRIAHSGLLKVGDGHPAPYRYAFCAWFDHEQRLCSGTFCLEGLLSDLGSAEGQPQGEG